MMLSRPYADESFFMEERKRNMAEKLTEQEKIRRQKMEELREKGIDPFGHAYARTHRSGDIRSEYGECTKEELDEQNVTVRVAGRIMTKRRQGKAGFMHIQDVDGRIQIYVRKDDIGEDAYELFKKSDIGDIVGIEGTLMRTNTGELSVHAKVYTHLDQGASPLRRNSMACRIRKSVSAAAMSI